MCHALLDMETDPEGRGPITKAGCLFKRNLDRICNSNASAIETNMDLESPWDIEDLVQAGKKKRMCPYYASRSLMSQAQIIFCPYNYLVDPSIRKSMGISLKDNVIVFDEAHNIEDSMREAVSLSVDETKLEQAVIECQKLIFSGGGASYNVLEAVEAVFEELNQSSQDDEEEIMDKPKSQDVKIYQLNKPSQELKITATGLLLVWSYLFRKDLKYAEDFCVVLTEKSSRFFAEDESSTGWLRAPKVSAKVHLVLNFWCMNPAVAFADFSEAHSVIVTSGTLSPMSSFQSELGIMFPHHLSTDHVIDPSQAWVASVACGPSGKEINGTYRNAITMEYQDEVGDAILKICQAVPFGVLCFFPSYTTLENIEPRRGGEFSDAMHNFDMAVKKAEVLFARGTGIPPGEQTGALFLAVFRGKLSEGIDFKDNHARAVITVSIPFPSMSDLQVKLKKKYNDNNHLRTKQLLPGNQWYEIQAYRAINQALGRCVRHKDDWGAIILLDNRFTAESKATASLSKWATKQMKHYRCWDEMYDTLQHFMKTRSGIDTSNEMETIYIDSDD
ncbi:hypothetical protein B566_EDAN017436 [Ephemera danica]|nr:hypothetical protein B566_EDAN017436 [Ephemera danica]